MNSRRVYLLDKDGNVQYGLNWGRRDNREPNQAYLQLEREVYNTDFFPTKGTYFLVSTDDGECFALNRAQKTESGTALQSPENNSIIGLFLRKRLGLDSDVEITKDAILDYGRIDILFTKIDDRHFILDFSKKWHSNDFAFVYQSYLTICKRDIDYKQTIILAKKISEKQAIDSPYLEEFKSSAYFQEHYTASTSPLQQIFYGAPGTGKSHEIDGKTNDDNSIRTTFHPDTDYATFVGAYKPMMDTVEEYALDATGKTHKIDYPNEKSSIIYKYEPQVFLKAYIEAWKRYLTKQEGEDDSYYLVIEEINRGNCAQIFGDLFQLLDREDNGYSSYAISPESAITKYLAEDAQSADGTKFSDLEFSDVTKKRGDVEKIIATAGDLKAGKRLVLPPNLHIWATMNTSDQSLFPIDSAFKRRWDWKYMPIKYDNNDWKIVLGNMEYSWTAFQKEINKRIYDATNSEDKQMGDWFVRAEANKISESLLLNKIVFYLWNDVCKDGEGDIFNIKTPDGKTEPIIFSKFFDGTTTEKLQQWMDYLDVKSDTANPKNDADQTDATTETENE